MLKLSERLRRAGLCGSCDTEICLNDNELYTVPMVDEIEILEHKATLWDKLCSQGCIDRQGIHFGFDVITGNAEEGYQIYCERNQAKDKYSTLEDALNQIEDWNEDA